MPYQQNTKILLAYHHLERLMRWQPTFSMTTFSHTPLTSPLSQCSNLSSLSRLLPPLLMAQTSILGVPNLVVVDVCRAILQPRMSIRNQPLATPTCLSHPAVVLAVSMEMVAPHSCPPTGQSLMALFVISTRFPTVRTVMVRPVLPVTQTQVLPSTALVRGVMSVKTAHLLLSHLNSPWPRIFTTRTKRAVTRTPTPRRRRPVEKG